MKKLAILVLCACYFMFGFSQDLGIPVGWATKQLNSDGKAYSDYNLTGGGTATPVIVSTYADLKTQFGGSASNKVIYVKGIITIPSGGQIKNSGGSNLTLYGLPGSKLVNTDQTASSSGCLSLSACKNVIIRNLLFEGSGAYDVDGNDNLSLFGSTFIWVDHCTFQDGIDGNFDITKACDNISVTWCKFEYLKPPKAGGSGGSNDHRLSNLIGGGDYSTTDSLHLNTTFQYCWWAEGCKARMPRVRYGKVHVANCYYNSSVANDNLQIGCNGNIRAENCAFETPATTKILNTDYALSLWAVNFVNCTFATTSQSSVHEPSTAYFTPPYTLNISAVANVKSLVTNAQTGAGATLPVPSGINLYALKTTTSGTGSGSVVLSPSDGVYDAGTTVSATAVPDKGSVFTGWSGPSTSTSQTISLKMDGDKTLNANFNVDPDIRKIAYVTDPAATNDTQILPALTAEPKFVVTVIPATSTGIDYSGYDLIILSEIATSTSAGIPALKGIDKPLLFMKPKSFVASWNWATLSTSNGYAVQTNMVVSQPNHSIFNSPYAVNFSNTNELNALSAVLSSKGLTYMDPAAFTSVSGGTVNSIATVKGSTGNSQSCIFEIPVGTNVSGTALTKKFLFIGLAANSYANATSDAVNLIKNACYYLMGGFTSVTAPQSNSVKLYPTEVKDGLFIKPADNQNISGVSIFNTTGCKVFEKSIPAGCQQETINIKNFSEGIYFVNILTSNQLYCFKIIKK